MSEQNIESGANVAFSDLDRDIALSASSEFNRGNYLTSVQHLNRLEKSIGPNLKLGLNKAVAEFFENDCKTPENLRKSLQTITAQTAAADFVKPQDQCALHYNNAVLMYHLRQPRSALKSIEKVIPYLDVIDESLSQRASILALELLLSTQQPHRALRLSESIENRHQIAMEQYREVLDHASPATEHFIKRFQAYKVRALLGAHVIDEAQLSEEKTPEATFLRARVSYLRGDSKRAVNELSVQFKKRTEDAPGDDATFEPSVTHNGEDYTALLGNNLAVVEFSRGRFHLAARALQHALARDKAAMEESKLLHGDGDCKNDSASSGEMPAGAPLHTLGASHRCSMLYNLGVSLLFCQRPREAFECLLEPLHYRHNDPRLWLRIAECCICVHQQSKSDQSKRNLVRETIGKGQHQKLLINQITPLKYYSEDGQSYAIPSPNLEFAMLCLRIVLNLIPTEPSASNSQEGSLTTVELSSLRNSALAAGAFVCLCVGDYILALEHAQTLLTQTHISEAHRLLGHLYCAEALVLLDKVSEAIRHLDPDLISGMSTNYPGDSSDQIKAKPPTIWQIKDLSSARRLMSYNLCVAFALRGDLQRARLLLEELTMAPLDNRNTHLAMLQLYIELQSGNSERGRDIIKLHCPQY